MFEILSRKIIQCLRLTMAFFEIMFIWFKNCYGIHKILLIFSEVFFPVYDYLVISCWNSCFKSLVTYHHTKTYSSFAMVNIISCSWNKKQKSDLRINPSSITMVKNKNIKHPNSAKNIWFFEYYKKSTYCYILSNLIFRLENLPVSYLVHSSWDSAVML